MSWFRCCRKKEFASRTVWLGRGGGGCGPAPSSGASSATTAAASVKFPPNVIRNQKYSVLTFLPLVLYNQFKFFLNLFFLIMAVSQFIPQLRIGYLYTYWGPLGFVISVALIREAIDDFRRYQRDKEVNAERYTKLVKGGGAGNCGSKVLVASSGEKNRATLSGPLLRLVVPLGNEIYFQS